MSRPRKKPPLLPIYDSLIQCAKATGIPISELKKWKREGCTAFRATRVNLKELLAWMGKNLTVANPGATIDFYVERARKEKALADQEEIEAAKAKGEAIDLTEAVQLYQSALIPIRQQLVGLPSAMAAQCNPTDPEQARKALTVWSDNTIRMLRETFLKE